MQLVACVAENRVELACIKLSGCLGRAKRESSSIYSLQSVSKKKYTEEVLLSPKL